jgi:hypothetical protein
MGKIVKMDSKLLKKIISEEIEKILNVDGIEDEKMTEDIANSLKRYKIEDLVQELKNNYIGKTRIKDIVNFFKKFLGNGPYYVISSYVAKDYGLKTRLVYKKEIDPESKTGGYVNLGKNYRPYKSNTTYSLSFGRGKIKNGPEFPVIVQEDMNNFHDSAFRYYVNDKFLEDYL